jgi:hypothetical protein
MTDQHPTAAHRAPSLDAAATDRAAGALLGAACGDALGVPYEFEPALGTDR